jgi:hypothetical protein
MLHRSTFGEIGDMGAVTNESEERNPLVTTFGLDVASHMNVTQEPIIEVKYNVEVVLGSKEGTTAPKMVARGSMHITQEPGMDKMIDAKVVT